MSLLQGVLKYMTLSQSQTSELEARLTKLKASPDDESDDETFVHVVSMPGSPQRTRPPSPTPGGRTSGSSLAPKSTKLKSTDPLKAFPTEVSQRIFGRLGLRDLSKCSLVSRKWNKSQTLNYVWFLHYRKDHFHEAGIPSGKWTKRESKQKWRQVCMENARQASLDQDRTFYSGYVTPESGGSGYQTPREMKEEKWRQEADETKLGKVEMRSMYKEMDGRKFRGKGKFGGGGVRDKGGWAEQHD